MEILKDFGINPYLLLAQIVNFLILLFILNKVMFQPLMKVLEQRRQKIAQSLKEAEQISVELQSAEKKAQELVTKANRRADEIVAEAKAAAANLKTEATLQSKTEAEKILQKGRDALELEKEKMRASLRNELMDVVVMATEKILGSKLTREEKEELTKKSLKELS